MNRKTSFLISIVIIIAGVIFYNLLTEPGIKDLKGGFKEQVFIRNEQNDGPVIRIYAVTVDGEHWQEMQQYGDYMPHTKYGNTKVFFFDANKPFPAKLELTAPYFPEKFNENCLAVYEKDGMSQVYFSRYPFKQIQGKRI